MGTVCSGEDRNTQHNTTKHNTTQHNTTKHNTTQHNNMPGTLQAKELEQAPEVVHAHAGSEESAEPCAEQAKAKDACLAEGGDCAELVKSFMNCMNGVGNTA